MKSDNIQIVLEIIIAIIALYLAFFKSYFQEKGKNLATKEDISEITELVETVKGQILYSTQSKLSLKTEERNALISHYEKFSFWLNSITDTYFSGINDDNLYKLREIENKLYEAKLDYELAEGRVELFVDNEQLSLVRREIKIKTLELQNITIQKIVELEGVLKLMTIIRAHPQADQFSEKFKQNLGKQKEILAKFRDEKLEKFREIIPLDSAFKKLVYEQLLKIIDN